MDGIRKFGSASRCFEKRNSPRIMQSFTPGVVYCAKDGDPFCTGGLMKDVSILNRNTEVAGRESMGSII